MTDDNNGNDGNVTSGPFQGKPNTPTNKFDQLLATATNDLAKSAAEAAKSKAKTILQEIAGYEQAIAQCRLKLDELRAKFEAGLPV